MSKTTNKVQYKKLLDLLSEKPDIAKGFTKRDKVDVDKFWENVAQKLNSLGPPIKDKSSWKKVWLDYKCYVKKKLTHNKKEVGATGGGSNKSYVFTDLEEEVIKLTSMETNVFGIAKTLSFGSRQEEQHVEMSYNMKRIYRSIDKLNDIKNSEIAEARRHNIAKEKLLQEKINIKKEILEIEKLKLQ